MSPRIALGRYRLDLIGTNMLAARPLAFVALLVAFGCQTASFAAQETSTRNEARTLPETDSVAVRMNAEEQFRIALRYFNGEGVARDVAIGLTWLRRAAEQGSPSAQSNLGVLYAEGRDVPRDESQAVFWIRKAALNGDAEGELNLGLAYMNGMGVGQDSAEALRWFRRAAEQGSVEAEFNLGVAYAHGDGVAQDERQARDWIVLAARHGYLPARRMLESALGVASSTR
jgi:TPR repeat protein